MFSAKSALLSRGFLKLSGGIKCHSFIKPLSGINGGSIGRLGGQSNMIHNRFYSDKNNIKNNDIIVHNQKPVIVGIGGGRKEKIEEVMKISDIGLKNFLSQTYLFTGGGIASSLAISSLIAEFISVEMFMPMIGVGFTVSMAGGLIIDKSTYQIHQKEHLIKGEKYAYLYSTNSPIRLLGFGSTIMGMSIMMSPMISMADSISPDIFLSATMTSAMIFGGSIIAAKLCPSRSLLSWHTPLFGGLIGLIGLGIIGIGSNLILGPNPISQLLFTVDTYGGIVLFMGMTAYDTQKAIDRYENNKPDHLGCSVELYLDFMNIMIRIMNIMMSKEKK